MRVDSRGDVREMLTAELSKAVVVSIAGLQQHNERFSSIEPRLAP